jgi:nitrogen-specific signal transduction histidine kinase
MLKSNFSKIKKQVQTFKIILFLFLISTNFSCNTSFFSDQLSGPFPYKFELEKQLPRNGFFVDLDHDRQKEYVILNQYDPNLGISGILLYDHEISLIDQQNYNGIFRYLIQFDWDKDGIDEIGFAYTNNDTSFFRIIDKNTNMLKEAAIFWGESRIDSTVKAPWEGQISHIKCTDLDNDGKNELVFFLAEGYAAAPRGVKVIDSYSLKEKWEYLIGPSTGMESIIQDFDGDGFKDILTPTTATGNGNIANGTDDYTTYLFLLGHDGKVKNQKEYGKGYTGLSTQLIGNSSNTRDKISLILSKPYPEEFKPDIKIIDPITFEEIISPVYFKTSVTDFEKIQIDKDIEYEYLALERSGNITLLDDDFSILLSKQLDSTITNIHVTEDLNNDNEPEIFLTGNGTFWINKNFKILAGIPKKIILSYPKEPQIYYNFEEQPLLLLSGQGNTDLYSLKKDSYYLLNFLIPKIGILFAFFIPIFAIIYLIQTKKKNQCLKALSEKSLSLSSDPIIIVDHKKRIKFANSKIYDFFKIPMNNKIINTKSLEKDHPEIVFFFDDLLSSPHIRQEKNLTFEQNDNSSCKITAEPIYSSGSSKPLWVIVFEDTLIPQNLKNIKTWVGIAQKIAHDIKNPLNSIQLTLQRLQLEYQKDDLEKVTKYNNYTENIIERIDALRHMSRGFMKFINSEELNPQPTDLNAFIENLFIKSFIELPKDIQLIKNLNAEIPIIKMDQDQIQTLIENLISNAVNAMLEGGSLTIGTNQVSNISFEKGNDESRNYVTLEIMDTGCGISEEIQSRLFQPYTTKSKLGTGLGLTIIKKIIDDHNGHIEVHSEIRVGTSVVVYFPA